MLKNTPKRLLLAIALFGALASNFAPLPSAFAEEAKLTEQKGGASEKDRKEKKERKYEREIKKVVRLILFKRWRIIF